MKRNYTKIKGAEKAAKSREHAGKKAPKGMNGETGSIQSKAKSFIVRRHMLASRIEP